MIEFLIGKASSGKTYQIYNRIKNSLNCGEDIIFLVPEQFTFESEKALLNLCGAKSSLINVFSFTKLCNNILNSFGGRKAKVLDDVSKNIFIAKALNQVRDNLNVFSNCTANEDLCNSLSALITEFSQADLTTEFIRKNYTENDGMSLKMQDFALIIDAYNALISKNYIDPDSILNLAYNKIIDQKWFENKTVYIDSFTGFTAVQRKIIELIVKEAKNVVFSFCCDDLSAGEDYNVFYNIKKEALWVKSCAKKYGVETKVEILENKARIPELNVLENLLNGTTDAEFKQKTDNITVFESKDLYSEIDFVANEISLLVKNNGYRYKDFAVIGADSKQYENIVKNIFEKYNIPYYTDSKVEAASLPLMVMFLSLAHLLIEFNTESLLNLLKTSLLDIEDDELNILEDYVYIWDINGSKWFENWDMNPYGFEKGSNEQNNANYLENINKIREKIMAPYITLKENYGDTVKQKVLALYKFLITLNTPSRLKEYETNLKNDGNDYSAKLQKESWESLIKIINRMVDCCGNDVVNNREFYDLLLLNINSETVGTIPQHTDEVIFGSADRIRTGFVKVAFLIGVNQGVFPAFSRPCGLLSQFERANLREKKILIPDRSLNDIIENDYRFYNCACTPSERVYFSYHLSNSEAQPSSIINILKKCMPEIRFLSAEDKVDYDKLTAETPAFEKLMKNYKDDRFVDLLEFFKSNDKFSDTIKSIEEIADLENLKLSEKVANGIFGDKLYLSASKIDTFNKCNFSFFCRYGLGLKTLEKAEISSRIRGTVAHYILEKVLTKHKKNIRDISNEECEKAVEFYAKEYFNGLNIDISSLSSEFKETLNSIMVLTLTLVLQIRNEFKTGNFEIADCELSINFDGEIKPLEIECDNSKKVILSGYIDRVDYYEDSNKKYIRVVDYKTNAKSFEFSDILYGQNLQMLIYLYCIIKNGNDYYGETAPAGVLYMPVKDTYSADEIQKMNGLVIDDKDIVFNMSETPEKYVPVSFVKSGEFSTAKSNIISENDFYKVFDHIKKTLKKVGNSVFSGEIGVNPIDGIKSEACKYCDFSSVCKVDILKNKRKVDSKKYAEVIAELEKEEG